MATKVKCGFLEKELQARKEFDDHRKSRIDSLQSELLATVNENRRIQLQVTKLQREKRSLIFQHGAMSRRLNKLEQPDPTSGETAFRHGDS